MLGALAGRAERFKEARQHYEEALAADPHLGNGRNLARCKDTQPEVAASVEYRWMATRSGLVPIARTNHHVNAVFAVKF